MRDLAAHLGVAGACRAGGVSRATYYRLHPPARHAPATRRPPRSQSARTLSADERAAVLEQLHSERFVDQAPAEVYATLLDEGIYRCSERTMYRLLAAAKEVRERRDQARHPVHATPQLVARAANQVWSWDITKLPGPATGSWFYLYTIIAIYSRYVPGWLVATREHAALAQRFIAETAAKHGIVADTLTLHADRGSPMMAHSVAVLLGTLGITQSHSRPHVSHDNPYSESQFKTLKYHATFPDRFGSVEETRAYLQRFVGWYNSAHHHQGIGLHTPAQVHTGQGPAVQARRQQTLTAAYAAHPQRFVRGMPHAPALPALVWINRPLATHPEVPLVHEPAS